MGPEQRPGLSPVVREAGDLVREARDACHSTQGSGIGIGKPAPPPGPLDEVWPCGWRRVGAPLPRDSVGVQRTPGLVVLQGVCSQSPRGRCPGDGLQGRLCPQTCSAWRIEAQDRAVFAILTAHEELPECFYQRPGHRPRPGHQNLQAGARDRPWDRPSACVMGGRLSWGPVLCPHTQSLFSHL